MDSVAAALWPPSWERLEVLRLQECSLVMELLGILHSER